MMGRALVIAIGLALLAPSLAHAKLKVAVVSFEGDDTGEVSDVMVELLEGDYTLPASKQVTRAIDKLGLDTELSDKDLKKLANELEVDAIVRGDLQKSGKRKLLHVKLYLKGKKIRGFKVEFASSKSEKFKTALKDKMDQKLSGIEPKKAKEEVAEPATDDEDPNAGKKKKGEKIEKTAKEEKAEKTEKRAKAEDEEAPAGEEDSAEKSGDEDEDEDKPKKTTAAVDDEDIDGELGASVTVERSSGGRGANVAAVRLDVGPSVSSRTLAFNSRVFEQAPKPYKNAPVGGMRVGGEVYPLAFGNPHSFIAGFGFAGHYDQTLKLNLQSTAQQGTKFPVEQKHWGVGLRFRIVFGKSQRAPSVTLGGGYFHRKFKVDRTQLDEGNIIDLPDVFYRGFDPGLDLRIPIIKQVAFIAGGQALLVTNTGQIQSPNSYGQAKVTAGQAMGGLDIVVANRVGLRVVGEFAQFGFAFTGNGKMTYDRDRDPTTPDIGGAADRYFGGSATLAVLY